jgi:hypothetical protein
MRARALAKCQTGEKDVFDARLETRAKRNGSECGLRPIETDEAPF